MTVSRIVVKLDLWVTPRMTMETHGGCSTYFSCIKTIDYSFRDNGGSVVQNISFIQPIVLTIEPVARGLDPVPGP